ncbi:MAG TPA: HdeA/HdeB family chaperone [Xanthobacteraceae bacterium]|nr:HdeA/HdeB family chaperone [Xanthobacteraceae bacterium]
MVATAPRAAEFQKPVTQWTCAEFRSVDDQFKPTVVYRATTYARDGQPEETAVDINGGIEKETRRSSTNAPKAPQDSFWSRLKEESRSRDRRLMRVSKGFETAVTLIRCRAGFDAGPALSLDCG